MRKKLQVGNISVYLMLKYLMYSIPMMKEENFERSLEVLISEGYTVV